MLTIRDLILDKLSAYLRGEMTDAQIYEWAVGLAVSQSFEETIAQEPLLQAIVQNILDLRRPDTNKPAMETELEYCRRCLLGEDTYTPHAHRKEAKHLRTTLHHTEKESPKLKPIASQPTPAAVSLPVAESSTASVAPTHLVEVQSSWSIPRGWLIFFRLYAVLFAVCSLGLHGAATVEPKFLEFLGVQPGSSSTLLQSLPHMLYALVVLVPPRWLSTGILFYPGGLVLSVGMAYYWFISISLLSKMHLNILFVLAILPFSAIPATLAFILLTYFWITSQAPKAQ